MKFAELVNTDELRELCESYTAITGAVTALLDLEGNVLIATGWQDICARFHRVNDATACRCLESDTILAKGLDKEEQYNIYKCKNGLIDVAVPIRICDEHVANFFTGQFFTEAPDTEYYIRQAEEFGFEKDAYIEALKRVPIFSEETIKAMMNFFTRLAQVIGEMGVARLELEEGNRELLMFKKLVENSTDAIVLATLEEKHFYQNEAFNQLFGDIGKNPHDLYVDKNVANEIFTTILAGQQWTGEVKMFAKDKSIVEILLRAYANKNADGKFDGVVGIHTDITRRKQDEAELHQTKDAAEAANIAKSRFLATMSHEIRTPMNGVIGMIELLQHTKLTSEQNELAEEAKKSGIELVHLLNDILDLSKIEADKMELESSDFNLQSVISDTINLLSLSAREKALNLVTSIDSDVPTTLIGDAVRLRQIISNIVGNAIKFTSKGSVTLQIQKETEEENSVTLRFLIKDTGIGMAANKTAQIFHPFTQANSSITRTHGGTGLGLTISKRLSELMGGSIGVESTEGEGSTFWFTAVMEKQIKAGRDKRTASFSGAQLALHLPSKSTANGIRILLAEDDPRAQKIVPNLLKSYGYQVDVACCGKEAVQAMQNKDYELVLMDCMMPDMSGYEVTAIIRDPASPVRRHDIPIIALTGNVMKQDLDMCFAVGMNDHLPKPLILADLLTKLNTWLKATKA